MLFVSFTSAYIVRQGLPTLDPQTNLLVKDWIPVKLPTLLLVNTFVLLLSSFGMELARRQFRLEAVLASSRTHPPVSSGDQIKMPWLAMTLILGLETARRVWFLCFLYTQQLLCLFIDRDARRAFDGRNSRAIRG
jgi:heme/copper-type cytochrome/quinol oxidase subunit 3